MGKKILVVVDYQYDFFNPDGALYVNGGEKLYDKIMNIIPNFEHVIFTQDCHPFDHCSFKDNGGAWPIHCVYGTIGAGIPVEFMEASKSFTCYPKGQLTDKEEYGAFSDKYDFAIECDYDLTNTDLDIDIDEFIDNSLNDVNEIAVCGIAGDYCVLETLKNIITHIGVNKVSVYPDCIVSIDGGEKLNNFINENNIKTY